jgi:uncharacterized protein YjbI with pentapeptide repeats
MRWLPAGGRLRGPGLERAARATLVVFGVLLVIVLAVKLAPEWLASTDDLRGKDRAEEIGRARTALLAVLAGLLASVGAVYTARTYALNREGHITDRFTRAIDQLGHQELDVRLGGIFALERVGRDSPDDRGPIVEVLTAYVREHAPWPPQSLAASSTAGDRLSTEAQEPSIDPTARPGMGQSQEPRPGTDVQAVLTVLGRRQRDADRAPRLDLGATDLRGTRLPEAHLEGAKLSAAHLEGADLGGTNLNGADLSGARLGGATLFEAHLESARLSEACLEAAILFGAHLEEADLSGANLQCAGLSEAHLENSRLSEAHLEGADLSGAHLESADLSRAHLESGGLSGAHIEKADLSWANLEGADLRGANLNGADLRGANLNGVDLSGAHLGAAGFSGANLERADLRGANLDGADLSAADLGEALYSADDTVWPPGFDPLAAGAWEVT